MAGLLEAWLIGYLLFHHLATIDFIGALQHYNSGCLGENHRPKPYRWNVFGDAFSQIYSLLPNVPQFYLNLTNLPKSNQFCPKKFLLGDAATSPSYYGTAADLR